MIEQVLMDNDLELVREDENVLLHLSETIHKTTKEKKIKEEPEEVVVEDECEEIKNNTEYKKFLKKYSL